MRLQLIKHLLHKLCVLDSSRRTAPKSSDVIFRANASTNISPAYFVMPYVDRPRHVIFRIERIPVCKHGVGTEMHQQKNRFRLKAAPAGAGKSAFSSRCLVRIVLTWLNAKMGNGVDYHVRALLPDNLRHLGEIRSVKLGDDGRTQVHIEIAMQRRGRRPSFPSNPITTPFSCSLMPLRSTVHAEWPPRLLTDRQQESVSNARNKTVHVYAGIYS